MSFMLSITLTVFVAIAFYKWVTKNYDYFKKRGIKYIKPPFLIGSTGELIMKKYRPNEFYKKIYNQFPNEKLFGIFDFRKPLVVLRDAELIKHLSIKDFDYFINHHNIGDENFDALFGNSLFLLRGNKWRDMRATLTPTFTGSKIRQMFGLVRKCAETLSEHVTKEAENKSELNFEVKNLFSKYSNDVIATTSFGIELNTLENPNNIFYNTGATIVAFDIVFTIKFLLLRVIPSVMRILNIHLFSEKLTSFFKNLVMDNIRHRIKNNIIRPDMINILKTIVEEGSVQLEDYDDLKSLVAENKVVSEERTTERIWTVNELAAQSFLFYAAGFETASSFLSFASYELALNHDIQQRLYEEIVQTKRSLNGRSVEYDDLQNMKYMNMFISEIFRMWPPGLNTDRECVKDYDCPGLGKQFTIKKGTTVWIPIYALHHDPKYFPNPEKFDPERFSAENKEKIVAGSYVPFGIGPRHCIGSRFALMEIKVALYYMLLKFTFKTNEKTQIPLLLKKHSRVKTDRGVDIKLIPRNTSHSEIL